MVVVRGVLEVGLVLEASVHLLVKLDL
jgi:hypothetical protein